MTQDCRAGTRCVATGQQGRAACLAPLATTAGITLQRAASGFTLQRAAPGTLPLWLGAAIASLWLVYPAHAASPVGPAVSQAVAAPTVQATAATVLAAPAGEPNLRFFPFDLDPDFAGAPDVSRRLPARPLTAQDRIVRSGAHFVRVGTGTDAAPNGERLKIYGINLSFAANFPTAAMAPVVARRLRTLGFNGVRLHHMDTKPGRASNPESILTEGPFPTFNPEAVTRLKAFIDALAREGIYVDLNLRVGYPFRSGVDNVPELPPSGETAPLHIFHPRMQALQAQYARELIERLGLARHPALTMVEINNESSLLYSFERGRLSAALTRPWRDALGLQWREWFKKREPGASDAYADLQFTAVMAIRGETFIAFLRDMDRTYLDRMRLVIQQAAGWSVPVTGTQMGYGGQAYVQSHADMDYLDEHFYVDHYDFPGVAWSRTDWRFRNNDLTRSEMQRLSVSYQRRDPARPWAMSEYNMAFPNQQGAGIMPVVAAMALGGDWDALYFFDYADGKVWNRAADSFTLSGDPAKLALTGQSAELFRAGRAGEVPADWAFQNGKSNDLFALETPTTAGIIGRQDKGKTYYAGPMTLTLDTSARGFATTLVSALDRLPLRQSNHLLITHVAGLRGTEPGTKPVRPKALKPLGEYTLLAPDEQGDAGPGGPRDATGPMWLEYAPARLGLQREQAERWMVYPLDERGQRLAPLREAAITVQDGVPEVTLSSEHGAVSPWYEVVIRPGATP